jgi:hypothetical protein
MHSVSWESPGIKQSPAMGCVPPNWQPDRGRFSMVRYQPKCLKGRRAMGCRRDRTEVW